jgi:hypothetical protein
MSKSTNTGVYNPAFSGALRNVTLFWQLAKNITINNGNIVFIIIGLEMINRYGTTSKLTF